MVPVHRAIDLQSRTVSCLKTKTHICQQPWAYRSGLEIESGLVRHQ